MIRTTTLSANRIDIFATITGQYIGDASRGEDGVFRWFPTFNSTPVFEAALLRAVSDFLDSLNKESTKPSHGHAPTATD